MITRQDLASAIEIAQTIFKERCRPDDGVPFDQFMNHHWALVGAEAAMATNKADDIERAHKTLLASCWLVRESHDLGED